MSPHKTFCPATRVSCRVGVTLCQDFRTFSSFNACIFSLTTCAVFGHVYDNFLLLSSGIFKEYVQLRFGV